MPIYEFYCADCHTIYNFFSRRVNTVTIPACPKCARLRLQRRPSLFSISKGRQEENGGLPEGLDEERMEQAMMSLANEFSDIDEDDPKQTARLMRRLYDTTGLELGPGMEEAIRRLETGEDPDKIEQEMGDALENEDPLSAQPKQGLKTLRNRLLPPKTDDTLYDLDLDTS